MLVAVGTTNLAKLRAVTQALKTLFPSETEIEVKGVQVSSGVSDQPMSDDETILGATNRANRAMEAVRNADFGIGLEGGIQKIGALYFDGGWIVVVDRKGKSGIGCSARYQLSQKIMDMVLKGDELGIVMDKLTGQSDVKQAAGAMGILTNGIVNRDVCYIQGIYFAFSQWISEEKYWI
ncbi:Non-canonical purine NTP phosphatase/PRRC1 [Obelidium mucronatum]|nr:Non-canonical purine NTP phosphatase/PRRC1 [Obelidium mucronatum]